MSDLAGFLAAALGSSDGDTFFVVPAYESPQQAATGRHFLTLHEARDAIRSYREQQGRRGAERQRATVLVSPGTYPLTKTFVLDGRDANTSWLAEPGARSRPVHSGGRQLAGN